MQSRDTIADRSHPQPVVGDPESEIMMLRQEIQQTQLKLFASRMQSSLLPEHQQIIDENEYLKYLVLAEAEIAAFKPSTQSSQAQTLTQSESNRT